MYLDNFIQHSKTRHLPQAEAPAAVTTSLCAAKHQVAEHGMVDHTDYILAVWDGRPSGTGNTVMYARSAGKQVIIIDPRTNTVSNGE